MLGHQFCLLFQIGFRHVGLPCLCCFMSITNVRTDIISRLHCQMLVHCTDIWQCDLRIREVFDKNLSDPQITLSDVVPRGFWVNLWKLRSAQPKKQRLPRGCTWTCDCWTVVLFLLISHNYCIVVAGDSFLGKSIDSYMSCIIHSYMSCVSLIRIIHEPMHDWVHGIWKKQFQFLTVKLFVSNPD